MSLEQLRTETGPLHHQLEKRLRLFETVTTLDSYGNHLQRLHEWLIPLEERLAPLASELLVDWEHRRKSKWVKMDLVALGLVPPKRRSENLPACANPAQCMGILYVLEGSSLGAQIITRHYSRTLGLTPGTGLRYFHGYGEATGAMWTAFLKILNETFKNYPRWTEELIASACATFRSYSSCIPKSTERLDA